MIMSVGYEFSLYSATIIMIKMQAVCLFGSVLITDRVRDGLYIILKFQRHQYFILVLSLPLVSGCFQHMTATY